MKYPFASHSRPVAQHSDKEQGAKKCFLQAKSFWISFKSLVVGTSTSIYATTYRREEEEKKPRRSE
jgi:hypothetical protein